MSFSELTTRREVGQYMWRTNLDTLQGRQWLHGNDLHFSRHWTVNVTMLITVDSYYLMVGSQPVSLRKLIQIIWHLHPFMVFRLLFFISFLFFDRFSSDEFINLRNKFLILSIERKMRAFRCFIDVDSSDCRKISPSHWISNIQFISRVDSDGRHLHLESTVT